MTALRCYWQVTAGILLGEIDDKFTRSFSITSTEWNDRDRQMELLLSRAHEAIAYATSLQIASASGREPNWVRTEFVWM